MDNLAQFWQKAAAGINSAFVRHGKARPRLDTLERELSTLTQSQHSLATQLERIRVDFERHGAGLFRKIDNLEQTQGQTDNARVTDEKRLSEVEQLLIGIEAGYKVAYDRIKILEASMEETTGRLETRCSQLKFLQDASSEHLGTLKTKLAEASSRLEASDNDLRHSHDSAHEQIAMLEKTLTETGKRFESSDRAVRELREHTLKLARQLEASLSALTARLEATENHVDTLERQTSGEHTLQQKILQDTQAKMARQEERMKRIMVTAVLLLVLVVVASAFLLTR